MLWKLLAKNITNQRHLYKKNLKKWLTKIYSNNFDFSFPFVKGDVDTLAAARVDGEDLEEEGERERWGNRFWPGENNAPGDIFSLNITKLII